MERFPNEDEIEEAERFVLARWRDRAAERGEPRPSNLGDACKFASLFAQAVFGGQMRGNWHHQWVEIEGRRIDLTNGVGLENSNDLRHTQIKLGASMEEVGWVSDPFQHDARWWMNPDHVESLNSCLPRVLRWVEQWEAEGHSVSGWLPDDEFEAVW